MPIGYNGYPLFHFPFIPNCQLGFNGDIQWGFNWIFVLGRAPVLPTSAQRTDSVRLLKAHLARACCARDKCVVRASSVRASSTSTVQLSNEHAELTWTVPSKHLQRTLCALIYAVYSLCGGMGGILRQQQLGLLENIGMSSYIYTPTSGGKTHRFHRTCTHLQRASE